MARTIATGPAPPSRAAVAGSRTGASLGEGISTGIERGMERERRQEALNPFLEMLRADVERSPFVEGGEIASAPPSVSGEIPSRSEFLQGANFPRASEGASQEEVREQFQQQDPRRALAFDLVQNPERAANFMSSDVGAQVLTDMVEGRQQPEDVTRITGLLDAAEQARSRGEGRRAELLEGRARSISGQENRQQPSAVREYQFARQQGFEGSFQDWQNQQDRGTNVNVDLGGLAQKELTKDLGDRRESINEQKNAALTVARLSNRINQQLEQGGAETIGPVGMLNRLGDSISSQVRGAARSFNIDLNPENYDFGDLETAEQSAGTRSNILSLAFAVARSREPSGRLSDTEVQQALNSIAANSGSVGQINSALQESLSEAVQGVDQRIQMESSAFQGSPVNTPTLLSEDLDRLGISSQLGGSTAADIPEGSERVGDVDGKPVIRMPNGDLKVVE